MKFVDSDLNIVENIAKNYCKEDDRCIKYVVELVSTWLETARVGREAIEKIPEFKQLYERDRNEFRSILLQQLDKRDSAKFSVITAIITYIDIGEEDVENIVKKAYDSYVEATRLEREGKIKIKL